MEKAPHTPFLPYFIGNKGNSIQSAKQVNGVSVARKLAQEIAEELRNPASMPKKGTLSKFDMLARAIRTMDAKQIEEAARELYYNPAKASSHSQEDAQKSQAW